MKPKWKSWYKFIFCLTILLIPASSWALAIRSFLTVPVAKGGYSAQMRYSFSRFSDGPLSLNVNVVAPFFDYGITNRVALITLFPIVISDFNAPPGGPVSSSNEVGLADIPLLMKVDVFKKHWPARNMGVSLISGLEIPSGDNPFTSNSIDFPLGVVFTVQGTGNEVDLDFIYQINTVGNGIDHGDSINYDISYSRRLLPWTLPESGESPLVLQLALEINGNWVRQSSLSGGGALSNTGGHIIHFLSGFTYIFKNWAVQTAVQIPVHQDLNGFQLENKFNVLVNFGTAGAFF
jgi:hypothetical protein